MTFGMPSIGVLCTALVSQVRNPSSHAQPADTKLPVSEIVQNLSLMIGFLNWVKPTAGNYALCRKMSQVVKRILDQVLEDQENAKESEVQMLTPDFEWTGDGVDDLEWLNSIDWTQGPFLESGYTT